MKNKMQNKADKKEKIMRTPEERRKNLRRWILDIILIVIGSTSYAVGIHCFTAPNNIAPGGVGGMSTLLNFVTGVDISIWYGLINVPLITVGFIFLGKKMMFKTFLSVAVTTFMTDYGLFWLPEYENGEKLLAALSGGLFFGFGLGIVYFREGTTGGTDIINKLINRKFPHLSLGAIMLGTDAVIIVASMFVFDSFDAGLYAIIAIFISSKIMDMILYGSYEGKMLLVFSTKYDEISEYVMNKLNRGVTWLNATGAYSKKDMQVICCAVHKSEYSKIKRKVKEIDPRAFIIISSVGEVLGEGFRENE